MKPILILLTALVVGGAIVWLIDRLFYRKDGAGDVDGASQDAGPGTPVQGCADENDYTPDEQEQWRDVLYTLMPADLLGWGQSIKHRGLVMPAAIREEFMQLAAEHRG